MGFPENVLAQNEKVVRSLHPHWLTVFFPCVVAVLIVAAAIVIAWATPPSWDTLQWIVIAVAAILLIIFAVVPLLRWRTTHYVITTHRVMVRRGILSKSGKDIALSKITDVSFHQSIWDRIIRAGSLHIESAGDSPDENFKNIPQSNEVQQLLNRLVDEDAQRLYAGGRREMFRQEMSQGEPAPEDQGRREPGDGWETQH